MGTGVYKIYVGNSKVRLQLPGDSIQYKYSGLNETKTLLNGTEINQIKGQKLTEISMKNVPLCNEKYYFVRPGDFHKPQYYLNHFSNLKSSKAPFSLIIVRYDLRGRSMFKTSMKVTLEDYEVNEEANNGNDFLVDLNFKMYINYQNRKLTKITVDADKKKVLAKNTAEKRQSTKKIRKVYTIKKRDTLGGIAKQQLGNTKYWKQIYDLNKNVIEAAARNNGRKSSSLGTYILEGTKITMPTI